MILVDEVLHAIKENNLVFKEFDFSENVVMVLRRRTTVFDLQ